MDEWWVDKRQLLATLADKVRELAGPSAEIDSREDSFWVHPEKPGALGMWIALDQWLVVEAGHAGGHWELDYDKADEMLLAEEIIGAIILGKVEERFGIGRSLVTVERADGSSIHARGYLGLWAIFPQPWWISRGPRVQYLPYLSPAPFTVSNSLPSRV